MHVVSRIALSLVVLAIACGASVAVTHVIDGTLPDGGDCTLFGAWDAATRTCRIVDAVVADQQWLRIDLATVKIAGTLTNHGLIENRELLVVDGFLDSRADLVNWWDGTMIVGGEFFSHFMYNFGGLTNESTGTIEFELHLENNAPLINHGHVDLTGLCINIPGRTIENVGSMTIASTGSLMNSGRLVNVGQIDNAGVLENDAEVIEHCESTFTGNQIEGALSTGAQSLELDGDSLRWCGIEEAQGYDVVAGDLATLRASAGDFAAATSGCLASDVAVTELAAPATPAAGQGVWVLVRAGGVASAGFDTVLSSQVASREAGIAAAAGACP